MERELKEKMEIERKLVQKAVSEAMAERDRFMTNKQNSIQSAIQSERETIKNQRIEREN
jgi:hypothetical protein